MLTFESVEKNKAKKGTGLKAAGNFFQKNKKLIIGSTVLIVVIVAGVIIVKKMKKKQRSVNPVPAVDPAKTTVNFEG